MSDEFWTGLLIVIVALVLMFGGCLAGAHIGETATQKAAIEAGSGEWRIDPKTGEKSFVWLTAEQTE